MDHARTDHAPELMRRSRRRMLGVLGYATACLCAMLATTLVMAFIERGPNPIVLLVGAAVLIVLALLLWIASEWFFVPSASDVLECDPRPPVVYLRPFGEDKELTYDVINTVETSTAITAKAEDFLLALNAVGPLVAIAEPDRKARLGMYPLGTHRDFVGAGDWQAQVQHWLDQAGMVVIALGDSPGIEWEIAQVRARMAPQSVLIYLPPRPANAWTRKGRRRKEQAIHDQFAPLVEKYFGITLPAFSEATYLIGFDTDGTPVMAPDAPRKSWTFTEHGRVADAIRSQLRAVLQQVRPGVPLDACRIAGRGGLWARLAGSVTLVLASIGLAIAGDSGLDLVALAGNMLPDIGLLIGWVLLARYFRQRWVWLVPLAIGLLIMLKLGAQFAIQWAGADAYLLYRHPAYLVAGGVLRLIYAGAVLALGVALIGRREGGD
jgi:hypothetical protein